MIVYCLSPIRITMKENKKLLIISPFTPRNTEFGSSGGGMSYNTANTIEGMMLVDPNLEITVLCEKDIRFPVVQKIGRITYKRIWERGKVLVWFRILKEILRYTKKTPILIQFEFSAYGDFIATSFLIPCLFILRILRYQPNIVVHQVILNLHNLKDHLGINNKILITAFSALIKIYYRLMLLCSKNIIVFEQILKNRLLKIGANGKKISVIPHGIIKFKPRINKSKDELKKELGYNKGDFVIVVFGYVTWYKGTDWLVNTVNRITKQNNKRYLKLIVAGGPSATLKHKKHYERFYKKIKATIDNNTNILLTGFILDEDIERYYKVADLLLFPYRVLMSSSGPLSWALVYEVPFAISENIIGYLKTNDAKKLFGKHLTHPDQLVFKLELDSLQKLIQIYKEGSVYKSELTAYSKALGEARTFDKLAVRYLNLLFENKSS